MSEYHDTCKREQRIGFVLGKLGIEPQSPAGDLLSPGIRGDVGKGKSAAESIKFFRPFVEKWKREKPEDLKRKRGRK